MRISITKQAKWKKKFCKRMNKTFGCQDAHMCHVSCPLWFAMQVEYLMEEKNYTMGEAFRQTERESVSRSDARKIFRDVAKNRNKPYPPKRRNT